MLQVSHLTKQYGKTVACRDISFALESGSVTVLLGPNGAGKSTLMKAAIGLLRYEGEITVAGRPNKTTEARRLLGYIPEMPALYPNLTVSEHMEFIARAYRLSNYRDRAEALLARFDLADKKKKFGDELSKGMQQKLNLCLGLLPQPQVLLLDEPTSSLDIHNQYRVLSLVRSICRQDGISAVMVIHDLNLALRFCDEFVLLVDGRVYRQGDLSILDQQALWDVYGIRGKIVNVNGHPMVAVEEDSYE